ncbi:MAG TPA: FAD/NAD(P)-binding oxidoreductase [Terriglobales bacterium]|nr:FAD/NAD(P)-binding oxidoreductase [Terriglobales bacterium]
MVSAHKQFDVLIVGGGPAGIAAAVSAAQSGKRVGIVDDNPALGGQIWRGETAQSDSEAVAWLAKLHAWDVVLCAGVRVFDASAPGVLRAESSDGTYQIEYGKLILATGARERFLPFPGWTLQNVMGAGALQALVKSGLPIKGKRVVVGGTGPLLLAVAAYLKNHGAKVVAIYEQSSRAALAKFALKVVGQRGKLAQAFSLRRELKDVPLITSAWPVSAKGSGVLQSVIVSRGGKHEEIACDYLACGFHLVPNTELAILMGCHLQNGFVQVDDLQQTSQPNVFCAGEPTGIGGVELSLIEGQIAGLAAIGKVGDAQSLFTARRKMRNFAEALDRTFALRPELKGLASAETIVCRCEDVPYGQLTQHHSWRAAKLHTRCGMGPCQGRVCGPAMQFLLGWTPESVRPPIFPVALENLICEAHEPEKEHTLVM